MNSCSNTNDDEMERIYRNFDAECRDKRTHDILWMRPLRRESSNMIAHAERVIICILMNPVLYMNS